MENELMGNEMVSVKDTMSLTCCSRMFWVQIPCWVQISFQKQFNLSITLFEYVYYFLLLHLQQPSSNFVCSV